MFICFVLSVIFGALVILDKTELKYYFVNSDIISNNFISNALIMRINNIHNFF